MKGQIRSLWLAQDCTSILSWNPFFSLKASNWIPILNRLFVGLTYCGSGLGGGGRGGEGWVGEREVGRKKSEACDSPKIAHRSYVGIQVFSLKAPKRIPILNRFLVGLTHCGSGLGGGLWKVGG